MNTQLLKQHITTYKKWLQSNKEQALHEQVTFQYQTYNKERMLAMNMMSVRIVRGVSKVKF